MVIGKSEIPDRLIKAAKNRQLVPFIGAGVSKQADQDHFPNWDQLLRRMIEGSVKSGYIEDATAKNLKEMLNKERHLMVAEALKNKIPRDYYFSFLEEQFDPPNVVSSEAHILLLELNPRMIITTNYDRLIENAYAKARSKALTVINYYDSPKVQRRLQDERYNDRPFLYKIHGDIEDVSSIVLAETDYRKVFYDELGYQTVLASIFIHYTVLFLGFSFNDEELVLHLGKLRHALKGETHPDYILFSGDFLNSEEVTGFRRDFGLEVLLYPADEKHTGLVSFLNELKKRI